jgi:hypothetical protein
VNHLSFNKTSLTVRVLIKLFVLSGSEYVEISGERTWAADKYYTGGGSFGDGTKFINNTLDPSIYQTERYGECFYEIPVPIGTYEILIHFAEM